MKEKKSQRPLEIAAGGRVVAAQKNQQPGK